MVYALPILFGLPDGAALELPGDLNGGQRHKGRTRQRPNARPWRRIQPQAACFHQLRVGMRRLRTALHELVDLWPGAFDPAGEAPL